MPEHIQNSRIALSVTNCICFDQRVLKMADALNKLNCEVTIIGRRLGEHCDETIVPFRTKRFRMIFRRGFLFYKFYNIRLCLYLLFHRFDILVANDLDTLLASFIASKLKRIPLVYDSHEYFTGVPELKGRPFVTMIWKIIERNIFPHLDYIMTVSDSIADQYKIEYDKRPAVIRNCSVSSDGIPSHRTNESGTGTGNMILIFQGGGINIDRGGEELLNAIAITEGVDLIIIGSGDQFDALKQYSVKMNLAHRIKFISRLPWNEMMRLTKAADVGLTLDKDTNLNYRFSLPNKLFDYISAGIPVIASGVPEARKIVEEYECGIIVPTVTPGEISKAIIKLRDNRDLLTRLKQNSVKASESLNWENESKKVVDFYSHILSW